MMAGCACGIDWIVEATDLASGTVRAVLHPISMDWETNLNGVGQGTLTLATKDLRIRDVWPHLTSVYISRVSGGGGASPTTPVAEFGGIIETVSATEAGTTNVGVKSIENYLSYRTIKDDVAWAGVSQNEIGRDLVGLAAFNGIPLFAEADTTVQLRDREYKSWARKEILEAVTQLTEVLNGPDWETIHTRSAGRWSSTMIFRDQVGEDRGLLLRSDRELSAYSLSVDAKDHATWVDAIGSGEEEDQLIATAVDGSGIYPQFDATPAWKDVTLYSTLQTYADGYLADYMEPRATPTFSVTGLEGPRIPSPSSMRLGDVVDVHTDFGAVTFHGRARIIGSSWALGVDEPVTRTYETVPLERASESVLNQTINEHCERC